ncbi:cytochrome P450 [Gonapodya prolifera JEL478]|uniref:Cytochrome P450 n=1 Tax=Gonapodya prolifera (strain JEL478) TaxID=1344416 RepID=A0A139A701_GONPJ|nr:cytochrome P450 [Gonapodya prolifera JEL478]|eukprot:KXS12449.1 cytochrome P450 [Gonapodya prolifera JEL478]
MVFTIIAWLLVLAVPLLPSARQLSSPTDPPRISLLHWLFLLAFDPKNIWMKIYESYGSIGVLSVPLFGKTYIIMGPENSRPFLASKDLDLGKGAHYLLGNFYPAVTEHREGRKEGRRFAQEAAARPLASPTFTKEVEASIVEMLAKPNWSGGFVADLFAETWDLMLDLGFRHFVGIDSSFPQLQKLKDMFYLVDPEQVMQSPRMWYSKKGLVEETQRNYQKWADLFKSAVENVKAKRVVTGDKRTPAGAESNSGADLLLRVAEEVTDETGTVDYYELMANFWGLILAAQVNTQANMAWLLLRIAAEPDLCARVMAEQERVLGGRGVPLAEVTPTMHDLAEMEFIDRMLAENLRLVGLSFTSFRTSLEDVTIGPYTIPASSFCIFPHATLNINEQLHSDPWTYDPDRTVEFAGGIETDAKEHMRVKLGQGGPHSNYNVAVWGLGKHPCVGNRFATAVIKMFISTIVRRCDLTLVKGTWPQVPRFSLGTSKPYNKVQLRLKSRVY